MEERARSDRGGIGCKYLWRVPGGWKFVVMIPGRGCSSKVCDAKIPVDTSECQQIELKVSSREKLSFLLFTKSISFDVDHSD